MTKDAWETHAGFRKPKAAAWDLVVPGAQVERLLNGFRPLEMEDKWFVYADFEGGVRGGLGLGLDLGGGGEEKRSLEGEGAGEGEMWKVHFVRSWTGFRIAEVDVVVELVPRSTTDISEKAGEKMEGPVVGVGVAGSVETSATDEGESEEGRAVMAAGAGAGEATATGAGAGGGGGEKGSASAEIVEARITHLKWETSSDVTRLVAEEQVKREVRDVMGWVLGVRLDRDREGGWGGG